MAVPFFMEKFHMSTFLEIMGELRLRDIPEVWAILARLEEALIPDCGLQIGEAAGDTMTATFDFAVECGGPGGTRIEKALDALSEHTTVAAYLTVGWDNIREKQYFGPPEEAAALKSRLALEEIIRLREDLLPADRIKAANLLLAVSL